MKFKVTFKTPDAVHHALQQALPQPILDAPENQDRYSEAEAARGRQLEGLEDFAEQWVRDDEYITIEFDTDANTATVQTTLHFCLSDPLPIDAARLTTHVHT